MGFTAVLFFRILLLNIHVVSFVLFKYFTLVGKTTINSKNVLIQVLNIFMCVL